MTKGKFYQAQSVKMINVNTFHTPVLLQEVAELLKIKNSNKYIDATIGGGGHSFEILRLGGEVLGIDCDREAIDYTNRRWKIKEGNLTLVKGNFGDIDRIAHSNKFDKVAGIIFDLGLSSHQLETAKRGFSFQKEGPLDMRMDQDLGVRAKDLIQILKKGELYELFTRLGEESRAWQLSSRIVRARGIKAIETTKDLVEIMQADSHKKSARIHFATKAFQALRIAVNDELNVLREALPKAVELLGHKGRLLVISFHSLEDRIVKNLFLEFEAQDLGIVITKKPITPSKDEIETNRRSRSAKLRVFERSEAQYQTVQGEGA